MMPKRSVFNIPIVLLTMIFTFFISADEAKAEIVVKQGKGRLGIIKGVVRDRKGNPISKATVAIFRVGTVKLLKQVTATSKGRFFAKIVPGTYTILAVAQGFNAATLKKVKVNRSSQLVYGFKLERSGRGNTLPEKRVDRKSPKWRIRAAKSRRSVYQNQEGENPLSKKETEQDAVAIADDKDEKGKRKGQTVVETFVASNKKETYTAVNFATLRPVGKDSEIIIAGQMGTGKTAPKRLEATLNFRPNAKHKVRLNGSFAKIGEIAINEQDKLLSQVSFQALNQWRVREGIVLVVGIDYSKFLGAGDDSSISPRLGLQFDIDSKTRVRSAYTTQTEKRTWQRVIDLEDNQILFREPTAVEDIAIENNKPIMNRNRRLEFGIERLLDNKSSIEANVFFDAVIGRGIGLTNLPFDTLSQNKFEDFTANQHGKTQGLRLVYSRRLSKIFGTSVGYSFGNGQKLSGENPSTPANVFENGVFQTFFGEVTANLKSGTNVKTIFRFSPQATIFAIDPFQGRLAIYDPGLSVMVTQSLPTWGLPIDAEAIIDGRNLFNHQTELNGENGILKLASQQRILRGGILVRF